MKKLALFLIITIVCGCTGSDKVVEQKNDVIINEDSEVAGNTEVQEGGNEMTGNPTAVILTNKGEFRFELYEKRAPATVANFVELAESGFYDGLTFHRYEPGFVIQGGDPLGTGMGGSGRNIPLEIHPELKHVEGALGMARSQDPNSASSQFYVTLADAHFLDGQYAVFGQVTSGMDVVQSLRAGDVMETVTIER
jgi:cyclophilin family peptidyl-prolyl cis-trans isomerase